MTGRDMIIFILSHNLEDTELSNILTTWFISEMEAAKKFNVGLATVEAWFNHNQIDGLKIGDTIYISRSSKPRI